jgi:ABC-type sugar transport system ATPase subunit
MANLLKARELTAFPYLDEVDLDIDEGEGLVLAGASGSGKSRLLRVLSGVDRLNSGEMSWAPRTRIELVGATPIRSRWTVKEHLEGALKKVSPARIKEAVELFDLGECLETRGAVLSLGERARLALACTLIRRPSVWLLDEPWQALDVAVRARLRAKLQELKRETACAWLIATQDPSDLLSFADRILVLEGGKISQDASPSEFYRDPATRQAGALLGMNFLEGRLDLRDGERVFAFADGDHEGLLPLSFTHSVPDVPGAEKGRGSIVLGIRPQFVRIARTPEALGGDEVAAAAVPAEKVLPGWEALTASEAGTVLSREEALSLGFSGRALRQIARVRGVEWLGRETRLRLELGGQSWIIWVPSSQGEAAGLKPGERAWVELDPAAIDWFDAQGTRLRLPKVQEAPEPLPILALEEEAADRGLKTGIEETRKRDAHDEEAAAE